MDAMLALVPNNLSVLVKAIFLGSLPVEMGGHVQQGAELLSYQQLAASGDSIWDARQANRAGVVAAVSTPSEDQSAVNVDSLEQVLAAVRFSRQPPQKYSAFDRELLAVVLAIKHFRWAVEGQQFTVLTDHKPLTHAIHRLFEAWTARQQRHLSYVAEFTSDLQHMAEVENVVADALSRYTAAAVMPVQGGKVSTEELAAAQRTCLETSNLRGRSDVQVVQVGGQELV